MLTASIPGFVLVLAGMGLLALAVGAVLTAVDRLLDGRHVSSTP